MGLWGHTQRHTCNTRATPTTCKTCCVTLLGAHSHRGLRLGGTLAKWKASEEHQDSNANLLVGRLFGGGLGVGCGVEGCAARLEALLRMGGMWVKGGARGIGCLVTTRAPPAGAGQASRNSTKVHQRPMARNPDLFLAVPHLSSASSSSVACHRMSQSVPKAKQRHHGAVTIGSLEGDSAPPRVPTDWVHAGLGFAFLPQAYNN